MKIRIDTLLSFKMKNIPEDAATQQVKSSKWMKILQLSLAVIPPIVFGVFPIIFTIQQNASARAMREQDQQQADETNRRIIFKEYIDDMKELVLGEKFDENIERSLLYIRIQTLTVLRHLDPDRKRDLILFLYENRLLRNDLYPRIYLAGADLNGVSFTKSASQPCSLPSLYLPGVSAANIVFEGCNLVNATFSRVSIPNARFDSCQLAFSNFTHANASRTQWVNNHLYGVDFNGASLVRSTIKKGVFQAIDLTNVDLYQSEISERLLYPTRYGGIKENIIMNTRYSNGSFSIINQTNLMAQDSSQCHSNVTSWIDAMDSSPIPVMKTSELPSEIQVLLDSDCIGRIPAGNTALNGVDMSRYSLLIDFEELMFNFTVSIGMINATNDDSIAIVVHHLQDDGTFDFMSATHSK